VVALTKADLVDDEILGLVRSEAQDLVAGSFLEGAPVVPVSSVTGAGLEELRQALARAAAETPEKDASGHFRCHRRVFTVKGFGTVATGTLVSGSVAGSRRSSSTPRDGACACAASRCMAPARTARWPASETAVNLADIEPGSWRAATRSPNRECSAL